MGLCSPHFTLSREHLSGHRYGSIGYFIGPYPRFTPLHYFHSFYTRFFLHCTEYIPLDTDTGVQGTLLVLSAVHCPPSESNSLYLHVLSLPLTSVPQGKPDIRINARVRVTGAVDGTSDPLTRPRIHRLPHVPSWRIYVSWLSESSNTINTAQTDVKNLPDLSNMEYKEEQRDLDMGEMCFEDTGISPERVLSLSVVKGII
jgi:hypothetical protein